MVQPDVVSRCAGCTPAARQPPAKVDAHGVSQRGLALNVDPDMTYGQGIVARGLADKPALPLADLLDPPPTMEQAQAAVIEAFGAVCHDSIQLV